MKQDESHRGLTPSRGLCGFNAKLRSGASLRLDVGSKCYDHLICVWVLDVLMPGLTRKSYECTFPRWTRDEKTLMLRITANINRRHEMLF